MRNKLFSCLCLLLALALAGCGGGPPVANHPPHVTLMANDACVLSGDSVQFTASATDQDTGDVLTYEWDFGDGNTAAGGSTASHTYTATGKHTARITVSDGEDTGQAALDVYVDVILIHGHIVDQSGQGVAGAHVSCEAGNAVTGGDGSFNYGPLNPGAVPVSYHLTGLGGTAAHYVAAKDFEASSGQHADLGNITAYELLGCGVVIESGGTKSRPGAIAPGLKRIDPAGLFGGQSGWTQPSGKKGLTKALDPATSLFLVYLNWAKVTGRSVDHYHVLYLGSEVWNSKVHSSSDPANFDVGENNYYAYLDFDNELATKITTAGEYQFQVAGHDADHNAIVSLPAITVSLGLILGDYPTVIAYSDTLHQLSWTAPGGPVAGYAVRIYQGATWTTKVHDSGTTLLNTIYYDLTGTGLTDAQLYQCTVDAQTLDGTGWTAEITRGIGVFTY